MTARRGALPPGSVVVVTGASSGIGRATALLLAADGARLVLASRSLTTLVEVAVQCRGLGAADVRTVECDVADEDQVRAVERAALESFGHVDAWVHTAATVAYGRFTEVPAATFDAVLATGLGGTVAVARVALQRFEAQGRGTLVLTGSLLGEIVTPWMSSYVTGKWAVRGFARGLRLETQDTPDVHVCVVSPGAVDTPVYLAAANHAGRVGRPPPPVDPPEKVARAIRRSLLDHRARRSVGPANLVARAGFTVLPGVFDRMVLPLMSVGGLSRERTAPHDGNVFAPVPALAAVHGRWGRHWLRPVGAAAAAVGGSVVAGAALRSRAAGVRSRLRHRS